MSSMKLKIHNNVIGDGKIRTIQHQNRQHWVLPIIMMVEGVHHGSGGPLLYTAEELGKFASTWNGTPVTIGHPSDKDGEPTSANAPQLSDQIIGRIYNAHMEGVKLKAEAWVDIDQLRTLSEETYTYIEENKALDVSIGVLAEEVNIQGEFNNEEYRAVARDLRPDHLALLPGAIGACSWDDGCGIRVNSKTKRNEIVKNLKEMDNKELFKQGIGTHLISNETGFQEIMSNIQHKLDQMDNDVRVHYLDDLFDGYFIYRIHNRETGEAFYYRRDYSVQEDGSIEFTTDPVQVRKDISFIEMEDGKMERTKFKLNNKSNTMEKTNASPCSVDSLIENEATVFTSEDKVWLSTLEQAQLDKLAPKETAPIVPVANTDTKKEDVVLKNTASEASPAKLDKAELKDAVKAIFNESENPETFINEFMPEGLKGQMTVGLKMYQDNRKKLIEGIVKNSKFEATQLENWKDDDLQSLHESVTSVTDFSVNGESTIVDNEGAPSVAMKSMLNLPEEVK